ncbi:MAG: flagellar protein FlgN [Clostridiaceae bacterium]|jgi:flagellar biosynthesis/type III secretory pathway chaperone|nr:flagellar protein FlgN [Clostridiaceae bacterium]
MIDAIWIDNLIKVLDYEDRLYNQLYTIAESKTEMIINGDIENLQTAVGKEQKLTGDLNKLKDAREKIVGQIAIKNGKNPDKVVVRDIIEKLSENQANRLSDVSGKLKKTIDRLKVKNDLNQKLLQNALEYIDFSLNLLTEPSLQVPQYGPKGYEQGKKNRVVLDIKS